MLQLAADDLAANEKCMRLCRLDKDGGDGFWMTRLMNYVMREIAVMCIVILEMKRAQEATRMILLEVVKAMAVLVVTRAVEATVMSAQEVQAVAGRMELAAEAVKATIAEVTILSVLKIKTSVMTMAEGLEVHVFQIVTSAVMDLLLFPGVKRLSACHAYQFIQP